MLVNEIKVLLPSICAIFVQELLALNLVELVSSSVRDHGRLCAPMHPLLRWRQRSKLTTQRRVRDPTPLASRLFLSQIQDLVPLRFHHLLWSARNLVIIFNLVGPVFLMLSLRLLQPFKMLQLNLSVMQKRDLLPLLVVCICGISYWVNRVDVTSLVLHFQFTSRGWLRVVRPFFLHWRWLLWLFRLRVKFGIVEPILFVCLGTLKVIINLYSYAPRFLLDKFFGFSRSHISHFFLSEETIIQLIDLRIDLIELLIQPTHQRAVKKMILILVKIIIPIPRRTVRRRLLS